ncbi:hypothetical protein [Phenylobacterium sp. 58.2.17]|uniref:hypothetical protein n=1 Tax=Phenylobacterium sp. 58.2.17 TaxID=2969306 RepID=UPI00226452DA|nr:hypothetical protein [Phenylobacterium sp. 58.2.17]MCX7586535.1 hypothetical protein [Phenylobacterium sp. 58.2.17]
MQLGRLSDKNLARTAAFGGGEWMLPLANLVKEERYIGAPARCDATAPAKSQFTVTLSAPRMLNLIALLFHTLSAAAQFRMTFAGPDLDFEAPVFTTDWRRVYQRMFPSSFLPWETNNWWLGTIDEEEIDLFRRHLWIAPPPVIVGAIRFEFDDQQNPDEVIDIGGLWLAQTFSPELNFDRGRELSILPRDLQDEAPSGRIFIERRTPRRQLSVPWSNLSDEEAYRFFDLGMRVTTARPVIFVPNLDDPVSVVREAFPALMHLPPGPRFVRDRMNTVAATFKEILA